MDVRIGVTHTPKEITVELDDSADTAAIRADVEAALDGTSKLLWMTDVRGRQVGVPADRIAYVDIGSDGSGNPVGFS
ncbi:MAG: DUF3107 domain-containing protein [Acidimicrobiia bacterium]|nr:DUF3107 domain-containing protein [Acidimicrobiia bacterium]